MENNWIKNNLGKCPVEKGTLIDVQFRDGHRMDGIEALTGIPGCEWEATFAFWIIDNQDNDIVNWRLHTPHVSSLDDALGNTANQPVFEYPQTSFKPSSEAQLRADEAARVSSILSEKLSTIADIASKLTRKNFSVADIKLVKDLLESVEEYEESR